MVCLRRLRTARTRPHRHGESARAPFPLCPARHQSQASGFEGRLDLPEFLFQDARDYQNAGSAANGPGCVPAQPGADSKSDWRRPPSISCQAQPEGSPNPAAGEADSARQRHSRRALARAMRMASGSKSKASTGQYPSLAAAMARMPDPVPMSRQRLRLAGPAALHELLQAEGGRRDAGRCRSSGRGRARPPPGPFRGPSRLQLGLIRSAEPIASGLKCRFQDSAQSSQRTRASEIRAGPVSNPHALATPQPALHGFTPAAGPCGSFLEVGRYAGLAGLDVRVGGDRLPEGVGKQLCDGVLGFGVK